jgi:hypothetical protein
MAISTAERRLPQIVDFGEDLGRAGRFEKGGISMAYERYESRRGWREPRSRFAGDYDRSEGRSYGRGFDRDDDREDRGFFERAGDELASWFGDEEAERRRREDARMGRTEDEGWRRPRTLMSDDEYSRFDRSPRFRDEGYRRPYTGRFQGRRSFGDDDRFDRGFSPDRWTPERERGFTGATSGLHDPHYSEWRRRQLDELDRDYDDYRRENQSRFENDFSSWRNTRQGKRQLLGQIRQHMLVVGSDEEQVGTVDKVRSDRVILTKGDSEDGQHHSLQCWLVDRVEGDRVILDRPAAEAKQQLSTENRDRALFERDEDREPGPHMLNRSFSGTYER